MNDEKIKRINELSKKSKDIGLTEEEKKEQGELRAEYIKGFKSSLRSQLDNIVIVDKSGNKKYLNKKN